MINRIEKKFFEKCDDFAAEKSAIYSYRESNKKISTVTVELSLIKIEFCYIKKASSLYSPSTLYCRFYLNKNSIVQYHLTDILALLGKRDFRSCYFAYIENPERLEQCFDILTDIIKDSFAELENLLLSGKFNNDFLFNSYKEGFNLKEKELDFTLIEKDDETRRYFLSLQRFRDGFVVSSFTTAAPYHNWICGKREKSLKYYKKQVEKSYLLPYEHMLVEFISSEESLDFLPMPLEFTTQRKGLDNANESPLELLKLFLIPYAFFSVLFCAIFGVCEWIISANTIFCFMAPWYSGFIPAVLCAIFGAAALRNQIRRLFFKNEFKEKIDVDTIVYSKKANAFMISVFAVACAFSLFGSMMMIIPHATFYEDSFKYANEDVFIGYSTYNYEDIEGVYYIKSRYNVYDDRIDRASYVIVTKDKNMLDLDGYASVEESENTVIEILKKKGFKVVSLDSDKELPV